MNCEKCDTRFSANWRSPSPGGYSSPGCFFFFNILLMGLMSIFLLLQWWILAGAMGFAVLVCIGANFTSWKDSNKHVGENGKSELGLNCPKCGHIHSVFPWSL